MKSFTVLVTSVGASIAHGVMKGLEEMGNCRIVGIDSRMVTAGNAFCDRVYQVPRFMNNEEVYFSHLKEIIENENIDAIFPCHPQEIELYEDYQNQIDIPVAFPRSPDYDALRDKEKTYELLKEKELARFVPQYVSFQSNEAVLRLKEEHFPDETNLVIKEVEGYGASGFAMVTNRETYLKAMNKGQAKVYDIADYVLFANENRRIMMKALKKPEYSVDVFLHEGTVVSSVPRKRTGVSSGLVIDGTVEFNEDLIQSSSIIAEAIATDGFINMQFMLDEGEFKLTDLNPRFCGSQVMSLGAGVNFPELFLLYSLTEERPIPEPKWNTRMMRYRESYFVDMDELPEEQTVIEPKDYKTF